MFKCKTILLFKQIRISNNLVMMSVIFFTICEFCFNKITHFLNYILLLEVYV